MTMRGIDTLAIARKLEAAGVDRGQAEAHAEAINESVVIRYSELATKADLERFPTRENPEPVRHQGRPRTSRSRSPPRRT